MERRQESWEKDQGSGSVKGLRADSNSRLVINVTAYESPTVVVL